MTNLNIIPKNEFFHNSSKLIASLASQRVIYTVPKIKKSLFRCLLKINNDLSTYRKLCHKSDDIELVISILLKSDLETRKREHYI